jgi:DNA repair ATPase RecN
LTITSKAVPVEERGLFENTCNEIKITPEKMFEHLEFSFKNICSDIKIIVDSVKEAETLSNKTNERYKSLENRANTLNYPISKFDFDELILELKANPLDIQSVTEKINHLFSKFELELSKVEDEYNYLDLLFNSVDSKIKELNKLTSKSRQITAENLGQLDPGKTLIKPLDNSRMEFINAWVFDLKKYFKLGKYKPVKIGLTKLNEECILLLGSERRILDDNIRVLKG